MTFEIDGVSNLIWDEIMDLSPQVGEADGAGGVIYQLQNIIFRSGTFLVIVLGFSFSANPNLGRVTLYLAPAYLFPNLILDDAEFGLLNYSTLGYEA